MLSKNKIGQISLFERNALLKSRETTYYITEQVATPDLSNELYSVGVVLCVCMHSDASQKEDLISVSCGPNCTSIAHD